MQGKTAAKKKQRQMVCRAVHRLHSQLKKKVYFNNNRITKTHFIRIEQTPDSKAYIKQWGWGGL